MLAPCWRLCGTHSRSSASVRPTRLWPPARPRGGLHPRRRCGRWSLHRHESPRQPLHDLRYDKKTGYVVFIDRPGEASSIPEEEAAELTRKVEADSDRYLEIPVLSHGEHHKIFRSYFATLPEKVQQLCNPASIGGFKEDVHEQFDCEEADGYWVGYLEFSEAARLKRAHEWLNAQGIPAS